MRESTNMSSRAERQRVKHMKENQRKLVHNLHPSMNILGAQNVQLNRRQRIYRMLERPQSSRAAFGILVILIICIFLSILVFFCMSEPELQSSPVLQTMEIVCTIVFTVELIVRVYVGTIDPKALILGDVTIFIDAASVLPFYVENIILGGVRDSEVRPDQDLQTVIQTLRILQLLRLLRVLKLMRHYSGWRVLTIALERSWRAMGVPVFAMLITILILSGVLWVIESWAILSEQHVTAQKLAVYSSGGGANITSLADLYSHIHSLLGVTEVAETEVLSLNAFESMWAVFWLVLTLGYDGSLGTHHPASRVVIALALMAGLLFTTMPITIIGGAFASAWEQKEVVEVAMKVQELLLERGHSANDVRLVFDAFDRDGNCSLDWAEFKRAMHVLKINLPLSKMRRLFSLFDADESGTVDHEEFCRLLFPSVARSASLSQSRSSITSMSGGGNGGTGAEGVGEDESASHGVAPEVKMAAFKGGKGHDNNKAWQTAAGQSWHEWRSTSKALFDPMLMKGQPASTSSPKGRRPSPKACRSPGASQQYGSAVSNNATCGGQASRLRSQSCSVSTIESIVSTARREAAKMRRRSFDMRVDEEESSGRSSGGAASPQTAVPLRGSRWGTVRSSVGASKGTSFGEIVDLSRRLDRLESNLATVISLIKLQQPGMQPSADRMQHAAGARLSPLQLPVGPGQQRVDDNAPLVPL